LIKKAVEEQKGIFDYRMAYEISKKTVLEKLEEKKMPKVEPEKYWLP
jgi:hypothetical protein